jgi:hypothetical protein
MAPNKDVVALSVCGHSKVDLSVCGHSEVMKLGIFSDHRKILRSLHIMTHTLSGDAFALSW